MRFVTVFCLFELVLAAANAQSPPALRGTVVSTDGRPIAGAHVQGDYWKSCCPAELERLETDNTGSFTLIHPTPFIRVRDEKFQPVTIVVEPGQTDLKIALADGKATAKTLTACPPKGKSSKSVGIWFQFALPKGTKIKRSVDTDTVSYRVNSPHSDYWLLLWSGFALGATDADDRLMRGSSAFSERWINEPNSQPIGIDAIGQSKAGKPWRWFGTAVDLATYSDVSEPAAKYFDAIIDRACLSPEFVRVGEKTANR